MSKKKLKRKIKALEKRIEQLETVAAPSDFTIVQPAGPQTTVEYPWWHKPTFTSFSTYKLR